MDEQTITSQETKGRVPAEIQIDVTYNKTMSAQFKPEEFISYALSIGGQNIASNTFAKEDAQKMHDEMDSIMVAVFTAFKIAGIKARLSDRN